MTDTDYPDDLPITPKMQERMRKAGCLPPPINAAALPHQGTP